MKISICYIQYNRINYLLKSLETLRHQTYDNIEVIISDDGSTDDTERQINNLKADYKYPIIYSKSINNLGYDRNYRRSIELGTGDYCFVLGNDDTIVIPTAISDLVKFLKLNNYPEVGFANYFEFATPHEIVKRASKTAILGSGLEVAIKYYNCFSFVGGLIYKKVAFDKYNDASNDGSIYAQMYISTSMVIGGERLFSIAEPIIGKDIIFEQQKPYSYKDKIARKWSDYRIVDGGLPSVINVIVAALKENGFNQSEYFYIVFKKIYSRTFPFWVLNYKYNGAIPEAVGLIIGLSPLKNKNFILLSFTSKFKISGIYLMSACTSFLFPSKIFFKFQNKIYTKLNK